MATETIILHLPAIHCDGCLTTVRTVIEQTGAIVESGDAATRRVTVKFDTEQLTREELEAALEMVGFPPEEEASDGDGSA